LFFLLRILFIIRNLLYRKIKILAVYSEVRASDSPEGEAQA